MRCLRRYVQSASRTYSIELAIFLAGFCAALFALMSLAFLFVGAHVLRAIANHTAIAASCPRKNPRYNRLMHPRNASELFPAARAARAAASAA